MGPVGIGLGHFQSASDFSHENGGKEWKGPVVFYFGTNETLCFCLTNSGLSRNVTFPDCKVGSTKRGLSGTDFIQKHRSYGRVHKKGWADRSGLEGRTVFGLGWF